MSKYLIWKALGLTVVIGAAALAGTPATAYASGGGTMRVVCEADFEKAVGITCTSTLRQRHDDGAGFALGRFGNQSVGLAVAKLPAHRFAIVEFTLHTLGPWRGNEGGAWSLVVEGGPTLIDTTFANRAAGAEATHRQAFPAPSGFACDFPPEQGHATRHRLRFVFAHEAEQLHLEIRGDRLDPQAMWAIDDLKITVADSPGATKSEPSAIWAKLSGTGVAPVVAANDVLAGGPRLLKELFGRLSEGADPALVDRLIKQLDALSFDEREQASSELRKLAGMARPQLEEAYKETQSPEARSRLQQILEEVRPPELARDDRLRAGWLINASSRLPKAQALAALEQLREQSPYPLVKTATARTFQELQSAPARELIERAERAALNGDFDAAAGHCLAVESVPQLGEREIEELTKRPRRHLEQLKAAADEARQLIEKSDTLTHAQKQRLVHLLFNALNDPARALQYASDVVEDKAALEAIRHAAGAVQLTTEDRSNLARWHRRLAEDDKLSASRLSHLRSAQRLLEQCLMAEQATQEERDGWRERYREVCGAIEDARWSGSPWTDLLAYVDIENMAKGKWKQAGGSLQVEAGEFSILTVPVVPAGSYELRVRFTRTKGEDGIFIAIPAGSHRGNLNISGWKGTASGLEWIDSQEANSNPSTVRPGGVTTGRTHVLQCKVVLKDDEVDFTSTLDGRPFVKWSGKQNQLTNHTIWETKDRRSMAVGAHMSAVTFDEIEIKMIEGELGPVGEAKE